MKRSIPEKSSEKRTCFQGIKNAIYRVFHKTKRTENFEKNANLDMINFGDQNIQSYHKNFFSSLGFQKTKKLSERRMLHKNELKIVSLGKDDIKPNLIQKINFQAQFQSNNPLCTCSKFNKYHNYFQNQKNDLTNTRNYYTNERCQASENDEFSEIISANQNLMKDIAKNMCCEIFQGLSESILNQIREINRATLNQFSQIIDLYMTNQGKEIEYINQSPHYEQELSNFKMDQPKLNLIKQIPSESKENFKYLNISKTLFDTSKIEKQIKEYDPNSELLFFKKENNFHFNLNNKNQELVTSKATKIPSYSAYLEDAKKLLRAN